MKDTDYKPMCQWTVEEGSSFEATGVPFFFQVRDGEVEFITKRKKPVEKPFGVNNSKFFV